MNFESSTRIEEVWHNSSIASEKEYERAAMMLSLRDLDHFAILVYDMGRRIEELEWELERTKRRKFW